MKNLRIVFMGTPGFAVPSLAKLVDHGYDIAGVITAPDRAAGRGLKMRKSPVKEYAEQKGLHILQPANLKSPAFLEELRTLNANLQVVVAFRMLPEAVWDMPELGTFNLHASLLPDYRGAAPINWAIINGEPETGVTTFFLKHQIDTGDIILQKRTPIHPDETAGELHERLSDLGSGLVLETVRSIETGNLDVRPQEMAGHAKKAPKIYKEDCEIDWQRPIDALHNFIRGLSPYPAAWTQIRGKKLKIYRTEMEITSHGDDPLRIISDNKRFLKIAVEGGYLNLLEVQLQGKKRVNSGEFLNGYNVPEYIGS